ncbi:uncharacterized protein LOC105193411 isoform X2 [Solenopsis invicta]|nr:uncharacterized protein LOC105193411 isoform X2 [Solenopsis invicta]XP_039314519.1 uncharacterized protein LOC105193411 isoform X2 [Solenopsis invicta]
MTLKDSVHQCVKESITMQVAAELTWWGVPDVKFPFYNTVLCQAIYQAVGSNRYYLKPTREEFQKEVVASLKVAKQRLRNARERHAGIQGRRRNLQAAADLYDELYDENVSNHEDENISNHEDDGNQSEDNGEHITDAENENNSDEHSNEL